LASKSEEELSKLSVELRLREQAAEVIQSRINMVNAVTTDLGYASITLDSLEKEKENTELLVPIGGNSYIKARLENPDKLIVGMGAGVSVEKTLAETKEIVRGRLEALEKTRISLQQQFVRVVDEINDHRRKLEPLIAELKEGKTSKNV
jgi:prefoldin alpha subunit